MDRINGAGTTDIGGGRRGFRDENLGAGVEGTEVTALWCNMIQEEILKVVTEAGLVPDDADWTQLFTALGIHLNAISASSLAAIVNHAQSFVLIADQKPATTPGGNFVAGAWRTRDLNTVVSDPSGMVAAGKVTLASNRFTLAAGKWLIEASVPAHQVDPHKARIYNVTDAAAAAYGTGENTTAPATTDLVQTRSQVAIVVTLAAAKQFEIQHICAVTNSTTGVGFGAAADFGVGAANGVETFTIVKVTKLD
ncbi:hypothetical protein J2W92_002342 [Rhizobium leguminosarum]